MRTNLTLIYKEGEQVIHEDHPITTGGLIRESMIAIHRKMGIELSKHDLGDMKGPQSMALGYLIVASEQGEVFAKDLEKFMKIRKSTASELVSRLIKNGYVTTERSKKDGRLKRLIVTEKGIEAHSKIHNIMIEVEEELTRGFSEDQVKVFEKMLMKTIKNMQD